MTTTEIKLEQTDLDAINEIASKYSSIKEAMGQLSFDRVLIERQLNRMDEAYLELSDALKANAESEQSLTDSLVAKYGRGELDITKGVIYVAQA